MSDAPRSSAAKETAGVIAPPPVIFAASILTGVFLDRAFPLSFVPLHLERTVGLPIVIASFVLAMWAIVTFHRAGTPAPTRKPTTTIVTHGPYRFTRNPIYVGFALLQIGLAVWVNTVWLLMTLVPAMAVMTVGVIAREERYLTRRFGEVYVAYLARVRRWI